MKLSELLTYIKKVASNIGATTPMIVGGIPRDKILNKLTDMSDIDITTGDDTAQYLAKELNILLNKKMKVSFKRGIDGHSSIHLGNLKLDFSPNFQVLNIDKYLNALGIKNPTSMQKELYSRDFTINTLLMDLDLKSIQDLTDRGFKDLDDKIINTCLAPEVSLKEYNRIIRSIYLATKLDFEIAPNIIDFVRKNPDLTKTVTAPKALEEKLTKAMAYNSVKTLYLLNEMKLNYYIEFAKTLKATK